jgi:hypothetical protein
VQLFNGASNNGDLTNWDNQSRSQHRRLHRLAHGCRRQGTFLYGSTDELGWKAALNQATVYDFNATILHLLGLDHEHLTYSHNGAERRLTDVHGHVIEPVLA